MRFLYISLVIIFSSLATHTILESNDFFKDENQKDEIINTYRIKLKSCFDFENKNKRKTHESFNLIEYCLNEFVID